MLARVRNGNTRRRGSRMGGLGVVVMGAGGSASSYKFDPASGLSKDPELAYYLQDLTPAQLQTALDGGSPNTDLISLLDQDVTGTGAGWLPCGTPGNPCGPVAGGALPSWALVAGGVTLALILFRR